LTSSKISSAPESRHRGDSEEVAGHGFDDHGGKFVAVVGEELLGQLDVVERKRADVRLHGLGNPRAGLDPNRPKARPEVVGGRSGGGEQQRIVRPVVVALELEDQVARSPASCQPDRPHGRLRAGVGETQPVRPFEHLDDLLGGLDLGRLGHREGGAAFGRLRHRLGDVRVAVTEDHRPEAELIVDVLAAVHVEDMAALSPVDDEGLSLAPVSETG
jgi:hypothetical protein